MAGLTCFWRGPWDRLGRDAMQVQLATELAAFRLAPPQPAKKTVGLSGRS